MCDHLARREWRYVGLWLIATRLFYAQRRLHCANHGIHVEAMPWSEGKRPRTRAIMVFLARWARRLSWKETAEICNASWEAVYRSVQWIVEWGLSHCVLTSISAIVTDELHWSKGKQ